MPGLVYRARRVGTRESVNRSVSLSVSQPTSYSGGHSPAIAAV